MKNPCYNEQTKTDCPKRSQSCRLDCPKWAAYLIERDKEYERRRIEAPVSGAFSERASRTWSRKQKCAIHNRTMTRGGHYDR